MLPARFFPTSFLFPILFSLLLVTLLSVARQRRSGEVPYSLVADGKVAAGEENNRVVTMAMAMDFFYSEHFVLLLCVKIKGTEALGVDSAVCHCLAPISP